MDEATFAQTAIMASRLTAVVQTVAEFPDGAAESYVMQGAMASISLWNYLKDFLLEQGLIRVENYQLFPTAKTAEVSAKLDDVLRRAGAGEFAGNGATIAMMKVLVGQPEEAIHA